MILGCDQCGKVVYSTKIVEINLQNPSISETYKVYCERCYMAPLQKIEELVEKIQELQKKLGIREKRVKKAIDNKLIIEELGK